MKTLLYYNGQLIHTIIHPKSVKDPKEAIQNTRDKIHIVAEKE